MPTIPDEIVFNVLEDEGSAHLFSLPRNQKSHLVALTPEERDRFNSVLGS